MHGADRRLAASLVSREALAATAPPAPGPCHTDSLRPGCLWRVLLAAGWLQVPPQHRLPLQ